MLETKAKVIAFDVLGTVNSMLAARRTEITDYLNHVVAPAWSPLKLPQSWEGLPAHADSAQGIYRLRQKFIVVTCSNAPLGFLARLAKRSGIYWDAIIPLELNQVYKPNERAYLTVCDVLGVTPAEVMMVTANRTFAYFDYGDCDVARELGMEAQLIRHPGCPASIVELAERLGC